MYELPRAAYRFEAGHPALRQPTQRLLLLCGECPLGVVVVQAAVDELGQPHRGVHPGRPGYQLRTVEEAGALEADRTDRGERRADRPTECLADRLAPRGTRRVQHVGDT